MPTAAVRRDPPGQGDLGGQPPAPVAGRDAGSLLGSAPRARQVGGDRCLRPRRRGLEGLQLAEQVDALRLAQPVPSAGGVGDGRRDTDPAAGGARRDDAAAGGVP